MSSKLLKQIAAVAVLAATIFIFIYYFAHHPETLAQLKQVSMGTIVLLLALYAVFMVTLIWIQNATLALCGIKLETKENSLLVIYSSIINFFGPLQSGPGFRAAYLKRRHSISLKKYTLATLMYYGFYAFFSGLLLLSYFIGVWILVVGLLVFVLVPIGLRIKRFRGFSIKRAYNLAMASAAQVFVLTIIYLVGVHSINPDVAYSQILTYTGAANFALFVSLTPGAIGFRESFLVFSQQLHGISNATILTASLLDRSIYVTFLLILAAIAFSMHAGDYLKGRKNKAQESQ